MTPARSCQWRVRQVPNIFGPPWTAWEVMAPEWHPSPRFTLWKHWHHPCRTLAEAIDLAHRLGVGEVVPAWPSGIREATDRKVTV